MVLVPVSGIVKVDGQPLSIGSITFYPDESRGNTATHLALAKIEKDGKYTLTTNGKPGAPPGAYKVVVAATHDAIPRTPPPPAEDGTPWEPKWLHHAKYSRPQTTDIHIEVVENPPPKAYDLELTK